MNNEYENTTRNHALSIMYDFVSDVFEYLERGGTIIQEACFKTDWNGFAWVLPKELPANPFEASLILNQHLSVDIDGVDNNSHWSWLEEKTLAEHHGTSVDFMNGMFDGCAHPALSLSDLLDIYNKECADGFAEYEGTDEIPSSCEDGDEFKLGVEMGQMMFDILMKAGVFS